MDEHTGRSSGSERAPFGRSGRDRSGDRKPSSVQDALEKMAGKMGERRRAREEAERAGRDLS
jgi:hypothetical protein